MAKHGMRVYSRKTGKPGFSNLYNKFSNYKRDGEKACVAVTREVAKRIRQDTRSNIKERLQRQSGELYQSAYFRRRYRILPTYEVGVGAEYAEFPEYGTGEFNTFGRGRKESWVYLSESTGQFVTTTGQESKMFFNDALENNLGGYPDLLKVEVGRMLR
jgi:hypothetical protein